MRRECPGTFSPPPTSTETVSQRYRHASRHVRHARAMMHVGIDNPRRRGKRSRHSPRMRNPLSYVSGKRSMANCHSASETKLCWRDDDVRINCYKAFLSAVFDQLQNVQRTTSLPTDLSQTMARHEKLKIYGSLRNWKSKPFQIVISFSMLWVTPILSRYLNSL